MKVIVFDLDETIGNFEQLGILWDALETKKEFHKLSKQDIFHILDLFPELFRPRFFELMKYLKTHRIKTAIFTNNQGPPEWVQLFADYTSYKIGHPAFNRIVRIWKLGNKIIEPCRTSNDKRYEDFLKCTGYPPNTQVCFMDDQLHQGMKHPNVYYIHLRPYVYHYSFKEMIRRLLTSGVAHKFVKQFPQLSSKEAMQSIQQDIQKSISKYGFRSSKHHIDRVDTVLSQEIMRHILQFLRR